MNTIKFQIVIAPLCGHQTYHEDCYMCRNVHVQFRKIMDVVGKLGAQSVTGHSGVALTVEAMEDTTREM